MRTPLLLLLLCIILAGFGPRRAEAFVCNVTVTSLSFGTYNFLSPSPLDSTADVDVDCNMPPQNPQAPLPVVVTMSSGNSGSFGQRLLQSGGPDRLRYNLYTTASYSTIWGDGGGSSSIVTAFVTSATPFHATIYGRIPPQQKVASGSYRDTLIVTVNY